MAFQVGLGDRPRASRHGEVEVASFQIKGWMAIPAILVALLFVGYRAMSARSAFDGPQGSQLKLHLQGVYNGALVPKLKAAQTTGDSELVAKLAKQSIRKDQIVFSDVGVKGTGKEVVAKVKITVAGGTPPDGKSVRYFVMHHQLDGWRVRRETTSFSYYSKLF